MQQPVLAYYNDKPYSEDDLASWLMGILRDDMMANRHELEARLEWCRAITSRRLTCEESEGRYKVTLSKAALGFTPRKVDDLKSWFNDMLVKSFDDLFRLNPTPVPTLSPKNRKKAVDAAYETIQMVMQQRVSTAVSLIGQEYLRMGVKVSPEQAVGLAESRGMRMSPDDDEVMEIVKGMRDTVFSHEVEEATAGAKRLQRAVSDALAHTGGFEELSMLVNDYATYPFMVGKFCIRNAEVGDWDKDGKYKRVKKLKPSIARVSPFDFYFTMDSTNTQDGMGVAERMAMRRYDLEDMKSRSYADSDAIKSLLACRENLSRNWLAGRENPNANNVRLWSRFPNETIDVFRMFLLVSGSTLMPYASRFKQAIDDGKQYQLEAWFCDNHVLGLTLHKGDILRPYFNDSYEEVPGEFAGNALAEVLAVIDATGKKTFKLMIRNMAQTVDTTKLVNRSMIGYDVLDQDDELEPGETYDFIPPIGGVNTFRPIEEIAAENQLPKLMSFYQFMDDRADSESGIPRYAMGNAQGLPSALRSTESLVTMIDSALKIIKARIFRLSAKVISPMVKKCAYHIMDNTTDYAMVVDADVTAQGLDGVVTKGLVVSKIQEMLQYLAPYAQNGMINPSIITTLVKRFMLEAGVDEAYLASQGGAEAQSAIGQLEAMGGAGQVQNNPLVTARAS